jgi:hypothetical protein
VLNPDESPIQQLFLPPVVVLADGQVLIIATADTAHALRTIHLLYDPVTDRWTRRTEGLCVEGGAYGPRVLLRDGSLLTLACTEPGTGLSAGRYEAGTDTWRYAGSSEVGLASRAFTWIGRGDRIVARRNDDSPLILLPDGRVLAIGQRRMFFYTPAGRERYRRLGRRPRVPASDPAV